jgi:hypothetical protein
MAFKYWKVCFLTDLSRTRENNATRGNLIYMGCFCKTIREDTGILAQYEITGMFFGLLLKRSIISYLTSSMHLYIVHNKSKS